MAAPAVQTPATVDPLQQLITARDIALKNPPVYLQIVPSILPIIGTSATLDFRRWGAEFLAETFASPTLGAEDKAKLALKALPLLKEYLEAPREDEWVVKSTVQSAASCYPLIFRYIIDHATDGAIWQTMAAIKSNILRRMDSAPPGVRVCCIKFVQRVVQTQTPGLIADPRRPDQNEISLALVPRDHPLIPPPNLEAEASGLLDRLLSILQENSSDALLVTATLNCLGSLIRTRASIANKIITTVLNFNPLKLANAPMTPRSRVMIRSMERTTRALFMSVVKKNPNHPMAGRIQQYLERLHQSRAEIFDETSRKRAAPAEPTDGLDNAKRQRLGATEPGQSQWPPPLPPPPVTIHQLFTLTTDEGVRNFDVQVIPVDLVIKILTELLRTIDQSAMDKAINAIRARYLTLASPSAHTSLTVPPASRMAIDDDDDDDEYEPDYAPTEDAEQISNRLDQDASAIDAMPPEMALGPFRLPTPPPLSDRETVELSRGTINRVFGMMNALDDPNNKKAQQKSGFNRLAARNYDRDAWITVISRLATRAAAGLEENDDGIKKEEASNGAVVRKNKMNFQLADSIREALSLYVVQDFRRRIDVAVSWLNEEWYSDRIQQLDYQNQLANRTDHSTADQSNDDIKEPVKHYEKWLLKMMDGFLPYLDAKDKVLIRFLSEVPELTQGVFERVKRLAKDPERVQLAVTSLHYLIMLKPPAREKAIDAVEDLWRNYSDAKGAAAKVLTKWRPHILQEEPNGAAIKAES
ncbi:hypothetical protein NA57DRAFT_38555 [Rhizodiscina lignyota]|uniref:Symplekin/Pta1 N-terminal domain-containing protein n=1 Tax=Rhizodiscina lignyota TaxID=1504668 RepID=A0A9P4M6W9_9PEZI|nr:hypothetical protein NA57DRAFT_38555 [Rhizodiscina lignyota]